MSVTNLGKRFGLARDKRQIAPIFVGSLARGDTRDTRPLRATGGNVELISSVYGNVLASIISEIMAGGGRKDRTACPATSPVEPVSENEGLPAT